MANGSLFSIGRESESTVSLAESQDRCAADSLPRTIKTTIIYVSISLAPLTAAYAHCANRVRLITAFEPEVELKSPYCKTVNVLFLALSVMPYLSFSD